MTDDVKALDAALNKPLDWRDRLHLLSDPATAYLADLSPEHATEALEYIEKAEAERDEAKRDLALLGPVCVPVETDEIPADTVTRVWAQERAVAAYNKGVEDAKCIALNKAAHHKAVYGFGMSYGHASDFEALADEIAHLSEQKGGE